MITLCVFNKRGDDEPFITYAGNIAFKLYKGSLFIFGASKDCDNITCAQLVQCNDNLWYAYVED